MKNFDMPTQVKFIDPEDEICYGIAYKNEIICACCGGIFRTDEVNNIIPLSWIDFCDAIKE